MYDDDDDDDQRQALGQPIFGHPYVEDDCGPGVSFSLSFFFSFVPSRHLFFFSIVLFSYFICAICCVWSCFVQSCQYHFLMFNSSKTSQCLGQSLPLRPLYRLLFFYLFFFSSKKEIKSAGTEKCQVFSPRGFSPSLTPSTWLPYSFM